MSKKKRKLNTKAIAVICGILVALLGVVIACLLLLHDKFEIKDFNKEITINVGEKYEPNPGTVCYGNFLNCKKLSYTYDGNVDSSKVNEYTIKYHFESHNKTKELEQIVKVVDTIAPEIVTNNIELKACPNGKINDLNVTASDNYDGDLTEKIITKIENDEVIIEVSDSSGNKTIRNIPAVIGDSIRPVIAIKGNKTKYLTVGNEYKEEGATATDNCDTELEVEINNQVDTKKAGTYYVTYQAKDQAGNVSEEKRTIIVSNPSPQNRTITGDKIVYLTFDDGPSAYTAHLLDVLKKYNVKATFFVTGFGSDDMILREYQEGHTVALHTNTHNYKQVYASVDSYFADLYAIQNRVERITGYKSNLIRFPGGSSNAVSKTYMSYLTKEVQNRGFHYFDWNVSSGDAGNTTDTNQVYLNVVNYLKSGYSIVLQHDSKKYSVDAVERIIQYGLANGFTFKALDENSPGAHHGTKN